MRAIRAACVLIAMLVNVCTLAAGRRLVQQPVGSVQPSVPVSVYEDPILVAATLAQQTKPVRPCPVTIDNTMVDPRTIMPPTGYRVAFTLQANGIRNYSCTLTKTISVGNSTATGLLSGDFTGVAGVNQWMYPQINLTTPQGQPAGTIIADSTIVTYQVPTEPLLWARWPIYLIQGPLIPWCAWVTRTNSTGGAPPPDSSCTHPGQVIQVPYTAVYTYYTCD